MDTARLSGLARIPRVINSLNEQIGRLISWLTVTMVLVTFTVVVLRYLFNIGWIAMQESVIYMHAAVFMLGAAYTLKHDGHVRVDMIYRGLDSRKQAWINLIGNLTLLLPVCLFITWVSWEYVANSWAVMETSQEAGGIPAVFLLKTVILLMSILLVIQGISMALTSLLHLLRLDEEVNDGEAD